MRSRQRGMSYLGLAFLLGILAMVVKLLLTVGPVYLDYYTLDKTLRAVLAEPQVEAKSIDDIKTNLQNRLDINNFKEKTPNDFVYQKEGNKLTIEVDYEVRRGLISNIDLIVHFKKTYTSDLSSSV